MKIAGLILCMLLAVGALTSPALATTRLHPAHVSGADVHIGQNRTTSDHHLDWGGGVVFRGWASLELVRIDTDWSTYNGWWGRAMVCPLRKGGAGLEAGYSRYWRLNNRSDITMIPVRAFWRFDLADDLVMVPHATASFIQDQPHDNVRGDLGLDLLWRQQLRLAVEWNVNEDFQNHPFIWRVGYLFAL